MQEAIDMMADGRIQAPYITSMPLSQARQAHELLDNGSTLGKIILKP
jgi:NADPH2:quinone reductase